MNNKYGLRRSLIETFRLEDENDYEYKTLTFTFYRVFSKNLHRGKFHCTFLLLEKVITVILIERGYALSRSQNDKTSNV